MLLLQSNLGHYVVTVVVLHPNQWFSTFSPKPSGQAVPVNWKYLLYWQDISAVKNHKIKQFPGQGDGSKGCSLALYAGTPGLIPSTTCFSEPLGVCPEHYGSKNKAEAGPQLAPSLPAQKDQDFTYCFFQHQIPSHWGYGAGGFSYQKGWDSSSFPKLLLLKPMLKSVLAMELVKASLGGS